jgi:hypothetical protein
MSFRRKTLPQRRDSDLASIVIGLLCVAGLLPGTAVDASPQAALVAGSTRAAEAPPVMPGPAADLRQTFELGCDTEPPDSLLGIQANFVGGDCLPGPPFSPGNLVGFGFPLDNTVEDGLITAVKVWFRQLSQPDLTTNIYIWREDGGLPVDACGSELFKLIETPIPGAETYSVFEVSPPVPMSVGERLWIGVVYPYTAPAIPNWYIGSDGDVPSQTGRAFANVSGDHLDWFDLDDFGWGLCYSVRLVLDPAGANLPPSADAGGPYCGNSSIPVTFDGTASSDPDGDALDYSWDFGDGATGAGPNPLHLYPPGRTVYTITLVVDDGAAADTTTTRAGIDLPPTVVVPRDLDLETALELAGSCSTDTIRVNPGTYEGPFTITQSDVVLVAASGPALTSLQVSGTQRTVLSIDDGAPTVRGFTVTGPREGIVVTGPAVIENCRIIGCGRTGILASDEQQITIHDCLVAQNAIDVAGGGIDLRGDHVVSQTTIDGNGVFGLRTSPFLLGETAEVMASIISGTRSGAGLQCIGAQPDVSCTVFWDNVVNTNCGHNGGGNFIADPLYCDPATFDYDLHSDSPVLGVPGCPQIGYGVEACGLAFSIVGGMVLDEGLDPIAGLEVRAVDVLTGLVVSTATTDEHGVYSASLLPAGGYRIEAMPGDTFWIGEYYDDVPSYRPASTGLAQTLWLTTPQERTGIDFVLDEGGSFSGAVVDAQTGDPLSGVPVSPFEFGGDTLRASITIIDGSYRSVPLPPGEYGAKSAGIGGYVGEYYPESPTPAGAMPVSVVLGQDTGGIDFTLDRDPTGVGSAAPATPGTLTLGHAVPNPFNPSTVIALGMPEAGHARLRVYDVRGHLVRTLVDGPLTAGQHRLRWDGRAESGRPVASGVYVLRLEGAGSTLHRRLVLIR